MYDYRARRGKSWQPAGGWGARGGWFPWKSRDSVSSVSLSRCTHRAWRSLRAATGSVCLSVFSVGRPICFPRSRVRQEVGRAVITGASKGLLLASTDSFVGIQSDSGESSRERGGPTPLRRV